MLRLDSGVGHVPLRLTAILAAVILAAALSACGGDDEEPAAESEASAESAESGTEAGGDEPTETTSQPPPEEAGGETSGRASERSQDALAEDAVTGPQSCPDVVVTPNSGDGLFAVEAEGLTCEDASAALQAWGASGYQGEGPPGFACEEVAENDNGSVRMSCEQEASGGVVEFDTGG